MARPLDDRLLRWIGIPAFGLGIPHLTGLFGAHSPREAVYWLGVAWFVALAWLIWHANRWLLFKQREHVNWFGEPLQKILLLLVGVVFGTAPVTIAMLAAWYRFADFAVIDWRAIETVTLTNTICVVFVPHVYETVFLIKERESDLVRVERAERARAEAELEALRAQLDPHFLFNSLNTLASLIEALHVTTDRGAAPLDRRMVPPIALQVLLENAVKHNELSASSLLEVRVVVEAGHVSVSNTRRARRDVPVSARVGLRNLAERYRVVAQASIEIVDLSESFAVRLPLLPA